MKCVKNSKNEIRRVQDDKAAEMVNPAYAVKFGKEHSWKYCPKSEWKSLKGNKISEVPVEDVKLEKVKKTNKKSKKGKQETSAEETNVVEAPTPVISEVSVAEKKVKKAKKD